MSGQHLLGTQDQCVFYLKTFLLISRRAILIAVFWFNWLSHSERGSSIRDGEVICSLLDITLLVGEASHLIAITISWTKEAFMWYSDTAGRRLTVNLINYHWGESPGLMCGEDSGRSDWPAKQFELNIDKLVLRPSVEIKGFVFRRIIRKEDKSLWSLGSLDQLEPRPPLSFPQWTLTEHYVGVEWLVVRLSRHWDQSLGSCRQLNFITYSQHYWGLVTRLYSGQTSRSDCL